VSRPKLEERRQTLLYLGSDCRKVVRRRALDTIEVKALVCFVEAVTAARAAGSGVKRFSGARIGGRLQSSERSIFRAHSR
jgi:hypothetical protein